MANFGPMGPEQVKLTVNGNTVTVDGGCNVIVTIEFDTEQEAKEFVFKFTTEWINTKNP